MQVKHIRPPLFVMGIVIMVFSLGVIVKQTFKREVPAIDQAIQTTNTGPFALSSPAFNNGSAIPVAYTCKGANINPPLLIENAPGNAKSFALVVRDKDASDNNSVQWVVWNIPIEATAISENQLPEGAIQGVSDFGSNAYTGPCPTTNTGKHQYSFELYALSSTLNIDNNSNHDSLISAMNGLVLSKAKLTGTFSNDK